MKRNQNQLCAANSSMRAMERETILKNCVSSRKTTAAKYLGITLTLLIAIIGIATYIYTKNKIDIKIDVYVDGTYVNTKMSTNHSKGYHMLDVQDTLDEDESLYTYRWETANGTLIGTNCNIEVNVYNDTTYKCYLTTKTSGIDVLIEVYVDGAYRTTLMSVNHAKGYHHLDVQDTLDEDESLYTYRWETATGSLISTNCNIEVNVYNDTTYKCYLTTKTSGIDVRIDVYVNGVYTKTMTCDQRTPGQFTMTIKETVQENQNLYTFRWVNAGATVSTQYYYIASFYTNTTIACYLTTK